MGVLIDDLITKGTQEPYRMFTSRAEYRLVLREDNADLRLTEMGRDLGLVSDLRWRAFCQKQEAIVQAQQRLKDTWVRVAHNDGLADKLMAPLLHDTRALDVLKRPEMSYADLQAIADLNLPNVSSVVALQLETQCKYAGYIQRQEMDIARLEKYENTGIPETMNYGQISGLSTEIVQKLIQIKPKTIAQAGRISGVTPAALSLLLIYLRKNQVIA